MAYIHHRRNGAFCKWKYVAVWRFLLPHKTWFLCFLMKLRTLEGPYTSVVMFDVNNISIKVRFSYKNFQVLNLHTAWISTHAWIGNERWCSICTLKTVLLSLELPYLPGTTLLLLLLDIFILHFSDSALYFFTVLNIQLKNQNF